MTKHEMLTYLSHPNYVQRGGTSLILWFRLFLFRSYLHNLFFPCLHSSCGVAHQPVELSGTLVTKHCVRPSAPLCTSFPTLIHPHRNSILLGGEIDLHVGEGVAGGGPAHEVVLPPLPRVELDLPPPDPGRARLHGVLGRPEDAHVALLDVLLGHAGHVAHVLLALDGDQTLHGLVVPQLIVRLDGRVDRHLLLLASLDERLSQGARRGQLCPAISNRDIKTMNLNLTIGKCTSENSRPPWPVSIGPEIVEDF